MNIELNIRRDKVLPIVEALQTINASRSAEGAKAVSLASAANTVLTDFYIESSRLARMSRRRHIAILTVMALLARLIDGYLQQELGRSARPSVREKWRETTRALLSSFSPDERRAVKSGAKNLELDFRAGLENNDGAQSISAELNALCLGLCLEYQKRHKPESDYKQIKEALWALIGAFEQGLS